ncbi:MAG: HAD family phosphatase [Candidatus Kapabacteria bacterium]|nr:HAD family phosphatase [Candidatus Kapabacteria bacterium]
MDKKSVFLDFGAVLYEIDYKRTRDFFKLLTVDLNELDFSVDSQLDLFTEFELGLRTKEEFLKKVKVLYCREEVSIQQIIDAWNAILIKPFPDSEQTVKQLNERGYKLYLLSNTNEIHFEKFQPEVEHIFSYFDRLFLSHQLHLRKPTKEYFQYVLQHTSLQPNEVIFIDDSSQHLATAKSMGITSYKKEPSVTLSELLHSVNIL